MAPRRKMNADWGYSRAADDTDDADGFPRK
jgi:hypothetical protein